MFYSDKNSSSLGNQRSQNVFDTPKNAEFPFTYKNFLNYVWLFTTFISFKILICVETYLCYFKLCWRWWGRVYVNFNLLNNSIEWSSIACKLNSSTPFCGSSSHYIKMFNLCKNGMSSSLGSKRENSSKFIQTMSHVVTLFKMKKVSVYILERFI